ncbi:MAG: glycerol-3-phosphate 1-O-acyltransferase PlsY [Phycisphaerales bacterium]|nr:glycerol-3-phosphate 1-O-acyltransferase PlsY [Phycisphaerales bacterium]
MTTQDWALQIAFAFVIGSLPFGVLIARAHGINLREVGSGNTGATNVGRALGRGWGLACFFLDAAKGAGPVVWSGFAAGTMGAALSAQEPGQAWGWVLVGLAAVLGHIYSPFLRFKGGKGVATACGAFAAMWPIMSVPVIVAFGVFILTRVTSGYVSLASVLAAWALPITVVVMALLGGETPIEAALPPLLVGSLIAVLVTWRHRSNIARIRAGTEPRSGRRSETD